MSLHYTEVNTPLRAVLFDRKAFKAALSAWREKTLAHQVLFHKPLMKILIQQVNGVLLPVLHL